MINEGRTLEFVRASLTNESVPPQEQEQFFANLTSVNTRHTNTGRNDFNMRTASSITAACGDGYSKKTLRDFMSVRATVIAFLAVVDSGLMHECFYLNRATPPEGMLIDNREKYAEALRRLTTTARECLPLL